MIAIGIDYGTTTSWIAKMSTGQYTPSLASLKSAVFITNSGDKIFCGEEAVVRNGTPGHYINSPKRYIVNSEFNQFRRQYGSDIENVINESVRNLVNSLAGLNMDTNEKCHITVSIPNCYNGSQMRYMHKVFNQALSHYIDSFELYLLPEPIAAALHYVISSPIKGDVETKYAVVCDIGGGTTDLAMIFIQRTRKNSGKYDIAFTVVATEHDGNLGGNDIDENLLRNFISTSANTLADTNESLRSIEMCKIELSRENYTSCSVTLSDNSQHEKPISREDLEGVMSDVPIDSGVTFIEKLTDKMRRLKYNVAQGYRKQYGVEFNWGNVLLIPVGGSMRIPRLRDEFKNVFPQGSMIDLNTESRETYDSVVYGAMYYSAIRGNMPSNIESVLIEGRTCHPISVEHLQNRLHPIVYANMPDGEYEVNTLRPVSVRDDGTFRIGELKFYFSSNSEVGEDETPDYAIRINRDFCANGRAAENIPISIKIKITHSVIEKIVVRIQNCDPDNNDYEESFLYDEFNLNYE